MDRSTTRRLKNLGRQSEAKRAILDSRAHKKALSKLIKWISIQSEACSNDGKKEFVHDYHAVEPKLNTQLEQEIRDRLRSIGLQFHVLMNHNCGQDPSRCGVDSGCAKESIVVRWP